MSERDRKRREIEERLQRQYNEELMAITERHRRRVQTLDLIERLDNEERNRREEPQPPQPRPQPHPQPIADNRMVSKIWTDNTWHIEYQLPLYDKLYLSYPYILGPITLRKHFESLNMFKINSQRALLVVPEDVNYYNDFSWFLFIKRFLYVHEYAQHIHRYGFRNFQECGYHVFVNRDEELACVHYQYNRQSGQKTVGQRILINSVIPYCRNGRVCYGMAIVDSRDGLRYWWVTNEIDRRLGFFEMFDTRGNSEHYIDKLSRLSFGFNPRFTAILLHMYATLLMRDYSIGSKIWCNTLFQGGTVIIFDRPLVFFIENERKLVTLRQLADCGAIDRQIIGLDNTLLMLQQIRSQTSSSVWCLNVDRVEDCPGISGEKRVFLRIPDRNAISNIWFMNSGWTAALQYVEYYQHNTPRGNQFQFRDQQRQFMRPFTRPVRVRAPDNLVPTKLWTGNDPSNWVLDFILPFAPFAVSAN